ncbi:hypothetical protein NUACC21_79700 [Scytonema sp. NUACC21]
MEEITLIQQVETLTNQLSFKEKVELATSLLQQVRDEKVRNLFMERREVTLTSKIKNYGHKNVIQISFEWEQSNFQPGDITVTVKTANGTFYKSVDVPVDMTLGEFRQAAQEIASLSNVPCTLALEKTSQVMKDNDTFESAGVQSGTEFILAPESYG